MAIGECQRSGETATFSGLYRFDHQNHEEITDELVVIEGTCLPFCASCDAPIVFHVIKHAPLISSDPDFHIARIWEMNGQRATSPHG